MTQLSSEQEQALNQFRPIPLIRNSERASFKTCQYQWNWRWNLGLVPAMQKQSAAWFGSAWHLVMAEYYTPPMNKGVRANGFTRGRDMHETWDEQMKYAYTTIATGDYFGEQEERDFVDARLLGHIMIDGYMAKWQGDPHWEVLMPEQRFRGKYSF